MPQSELIARCATLVAALAGFVLGGCATPIDPKEMKAPGQVSCIEVPKGVEAHEIRGLLSVHWTIRVSPGPYISEYEDAQGTYYRAPPGGIYYVRDGTEDKPEALFTHMTHDGGIWMPHDAAKPPHLYQYFSTRSAPVVPLPDGLSCANAVYVRDPDSKGVDTVVLATSFTAGGAAGGMLARAAVPNSSLSYGQAAGAGAAGGLIAGLIISSIINEDVGKIVHGSESTDPAFVAALQRLGKSAVPLRRASIQHVAPH